MDPGGPANALGASLGRGLSSLTNGGRFGNDSVKHVVTTQGFGATVNVEDLVNVVKSLVTTTSPEGMECGGANSDIVKVKSWPISRTRVCQMHANPAPRSYCDCCSWEGSEAVWQNTLFITDRCIINTKTTGGCPPFPGVVPYSQTRSKGALGISPYPIKEPSVLSPRHSPCLPHRCFGRDGRRCCSPLPRLIQS